MRLIGLLALWTAAVLAFCVVAHFVWRAFGSRVDPERFWRVDVDDVVMRVVDVMLAFPFLLLLMAITSAALGTPQGGLNYSYANKSMDQAIAEKIGTTTRFKSLHFAVASTSKRIQSARLPACNSPHRRQAGPSFGILILASSAATAPPV